MLDFIMIFLYTVAVVLHLFGAYMIYFGAYSE